MAAYVLLYRVRLMKSEYLLKAFALSVAVMLTLCGCGGNGGGADKGYDIEVKTEGGMPLEDIRVKVFKDKKLDDMVWAAETDDEGKISFEAESSSKYVAVLEEIPNGYRVEKYYALKDESTSLLLKADMKADAKLSDATYALGDIIGDHKITAADGKTYQISEILKSKKAVVLNFWFLNCQPCKMEFPYLETAYKQYKEDIEVIAVNPLDGTDSTVSEFADSLQLTFPVAAGESEWGSSMRLSAYPTTVVIDRFGMIAMMHRGAVIEDGVFEKIFEYFAADDYSQSIIKNISDIK